MGKKSWAYPWLAGLRGKPKGNQRETKGKPKGNQRETKGKPKGNQRTEFVYFRHLKTNTVSNRQTLTLPGPKIQSPARNLSFTLRSASTRSDTDPVQRPSFLLKGPRIGPQPCIVVPSPQRPTFGWPGGSWTGRAGRTSPECLKQTRN